MQENTRGAPPKYINTKSAYVLGLETLGIVVSLFFMICIKDNVPHLFKVMNVECMGSIDLKKVESIYKLLFECARDMVFLVDMNGKILDVNYAAVKEYGYTRDEMMSMTVNDLRSPGQRGSIEKNFNEAFAHGAIYETIHTRKDGSKFPVEVSSRGLTLDEKKMLIAIVRDSTKRKEAERTYSRIVAIVESSDDAILGMTLDGIITDWNRGAEKIYGYTAKEMLGRSVEVLIPKDRAEELSHITEVIRQGMRLEHFDTLRIRKDGKPVPVSLNASPIIPKGEIIGISWTARDITERRKYEEVLRESERRFRNIYDQAPIGIALIDSITGRFLQINPKYVKIIGRTEEEMQKTTFMAISHPDDLQEDIDNMAKLLAGDIKSFNMQKRLFRGDGSIIWVNLTVVPLWEEDELDYPRVHIAMAEDITNRKKIEDALGNAKDQAELYLDLMGHDINNMNQIAMGFLEIALESFHLADEEKKILEKSMDALKNSTTLIENVRKLQKLEEGSLKYRKIDLCNILKEVKDDYSHIPGRSVTINFKLIPHGYVVANEFIKDVFSNLVGNAIKHSDPQKPLIIDIGLEQMREKGKDYYKVIVEDNGPGVPDELKSKLFMRFQRGKTKASGKGLGLYLVRTLAADFHGKIWVEDRVPGDYTKGARFVVMLPVAEK
jgi:PAS domain S-box-containing protein